VAEFVTYLHDQSIYLFTLKRGITEEDLLQVNRLLAGGGKALPPGLSLPEAVAQFSRGHAEVQVVDWSRSEFTDEATIDLMEQGRAGSGETSWDSFPRSSASSSSASTVS
jgi:hypothetical protein